MNKNFFSVMFFLSLVAQPAYLWSGMVDQFFVDAWRVIKPEWSTGSKQVTEYKKNGHSQPGEYELAYGESKKDGEESKPYLMGGWYDLLRAKMAQMEEGEDVSVWLSGLSEVGKKPVQFTLKGDGGDRHYAVDVNGMVFFADDTGGLREVPTKESLKYIGLQNGNGAPMFVLNSSSKFAEKSTKMEHEDQTQEKQKSMRSFQSLYRFKRDTNLCGCYIFMKPYRIACVAGITFGAYKLFQKLRIAERFLKPNTHGLEADELDAP